MRKPALKWEQHNGQFILITNLLANYPEFTVWSGGLDGSWRTTPRCGIDAPFTYSTAEEAQIACENYLFEWIKPLVLMSKQIEAANKQIKEKI